MSDNPSSSPTEKNVATPAGEIGQIKMNTVIRRSKKQKSEEPTCSSSSNNTAIVPFPSPAGLKVEEEDDDFEGEYTSMYIYS
jgi:hypothetical protein